MKIRTALSWALVAALAVSLLVVLRSSMAKIQGRQLVELSRPTP